MKNVKVSQTRKLHPRASNVRRKFERMLHALAWISIEKLSGLENSSWRYNKKKEFWMRLRAFESGKDFDKQWQSGSSTALKSRGKPLQIVETV